MKSRFFSGLALIFLTAGAVALQAQTVVRFAPPENDNDPRHEYTHGLLTKALEATKKQFGDFKLEPGPKLTHGQAMLSLKEGKSLDVFISMTSAPMEEMFTPVRVPLFKGLIGYRVLLIHKKHLDFFQQLAPEQLKTVPMVQGAIWPDTKILKANGYNVIGADVYNSLFLMLSHEEPRAFPRAVHEVWEELERYPDLMIMPGMYFQYPTALYYFVKKDREDLAKRIETGMNMLIDDGRFDASFKMFLGNNIQKAALDKKVKIALSNPLLPEKTPESVKKYWFAPVSERR